ncbi:hypothetical protein BD408DRAFT_403811 [Parasitella parasitica]|nr:hypothetical protein BD408DRAFT_403811 [Parasitella parasitica]
MPTIKTSEHEVVVVKKEGDANIEKTFRFSMIAPSETVRHLVANPATTDRIIALPDQTVGELVESTQDLMAEAFEVNAISENYFCIQAHVRPVAISVPSIQEVISNQPELYRFTYPPSIANDQQQLSVFQATFRQICHFWRFKKPSDGKVPWRNYMRAKIVPLNLFTDDMSGKKTKKHNKFDSWILVPAALPLKQRHQLENTHCICTDHNLSAMQMLPAIVDDLAKLEEGLINSFSKFRIYALQFITADNARHSEIASSRGAISSRPCRKCDWELTTPPKADGTDYECSRRSEQIVEELNDRFLQSGDSRVLVDKERGYKLVGGQALLRLKAFETMIDNPIELLHTVMLGVGKALFKSLYANHLNQLQKSTLQTLLFSYNSKGFKRKLRSSLRLHGSYLGRDYKILLQQIPILLDKLIESHAIEATPDLMAEAFEVNAISENYFCIQAHVQPVAISVPSIQEVISDQPESYRFTYPPSIANDQQQLSVFQATFRQICYFWRFKKPSDGKVPWRKYMPVKIVPLNLFTDDMSGNKTKKHNKFDSWILVPAALPLKQRHQLENTHFICTDHNLSAMQMLPAIVDDLAKLEEGLIMHSPNSESTLVIAPVQFITADNARHSEIASSRGAISSRPCRKCDWELTTPPKADGTDYECSRRSEQIVEELNDRFLQSGCLLTRKEGISLLVAKLC